MKPEIILIAKVFGIALSITAIGILFHRAFFQKAIENLVENPGTLYFFRISSLIFGLFLIHVHNSWQLHWSTVITLIGWIWTIKGATFFLFPNNTISYLQNIKSNNHLFTVAGVICLLLGSLLLLGGHGVI